MENHDAENTRCRPIGDLAKSISQPVGLRATTEPRSNGLPSNSATGLQPVRSGTRTGMPRSETGSNRTLPAVRSTDAERLASLDYAAHKAAVEGLLPPALEWRRDTQMMPATDFRPATTLEVGPLRLRGPQSAKDQASRAIQATMAPLQTIDLMRELAKLEAVTTRKKETETQDELKAEAYREFLEGYPADAVLWAIRHWPKTKDGKWFPSGKEILELIEIRTAHRTRLLAALTS